jgi:hypothetical protein
LPLAGNELDGQRENINRHYNSETVAREQLGAFNCARHAFMIGRLATGATVIICASLQNLLPPPPAIQDKDSGGGDKSMRAHHNGLFTLFKLSPQFEIQLSASQRKPILAQYGSRN